MVTEEDDDNDDTDDNDDDEEEEEEEEEEEKVADLFADPLGVDDSDKSAVVIVVVVVVVVAVLAVAVEILAEIFEVHLSLHAGQYPIDLFSELSTGLLSAQEQQCWEDKMSHSCPQVFNLCTLGQ